MSGPNDSYDPKQVSPLSAEAVASMVADAVAAIAVATTLADLKAARTAHAGERSPIALANREIGALPPAARKETGARLGQARAEIQQALVAREAEIGEVELARTLIVERVDMTLPVEVAPVGAVHPITALMDQLGDVFIGMGWEIAEGPELEAEWLNFDALNIGPDHPARGTTDTLFVDPVDSHLVLRTHTSPVQVRSLLDRPLPVYVVCPGKVYRADEFDATHVPVFHQIEGLCVDKGISMAHLRGTLDHLARAMFGDVRTRMRPNYFPFTEPSAEVDIAFASGPLKGRWLEVGGAGQVHPSVVRNYGLDPEHYIGFAFGLGPDRLTMLRYGVNDLRLFFEGDLRFLSQFR